MKNYTDSCPKSEIILYQPNEPVPLGTRLDVQHQFAEYLSKRLIAKKSVYSIFKYTDGKNYQKNVRPIIPKSKSFICFLEKLY